MKISEINQRLKSGEQLSRTIVPKDRVGNVIFSTKITYFIGEQKITESQYLTVKSKNKLVKDIDRSNQYSSYYKLLL